MEKQVVPFEIAKQLKGIEFDEECNCIYDEKGIRGFNLKPYKNTKEDTWNVTAPLWQQVFDWFREVHSLHIEIQSPDYINEVDWSYSIHIPNKFGAHHGDVMQFPSYDETKLEAIKYCIERIKNKK